MSDGIAPAIDKVARGESLDRTEAERAMEAILGGSSTTEQISALLMGLRAKGESIDEITGFASTMRPVSPSRIRMGDIHRICTFGGTVIEGLRHPSRTNGHLLTVSAKSRSK